MSSKSPQMKASSEAAANREYGTPLFGPPVPMPQHRRLKTFRFDPMSSRQTGRSMEVTVSYERDIGPGPSGKLVKVVDYDPVRNKWYAQLNLNDPFLAESGLAPDARDPRCHQQIVYAVAMSVIERFERHLGRQFRWWSDSVLLLVPHAFAGANAYFDPEHNAVLFGYFEADKDDPGANLPGQTVFTCLSSDIIAHEVTHAVINRVRFYYRYSTNPDVFAFHEAVADLMALFQHFAYRDVVAEAIKSEGGGVKIDNFMFHLADEFGHSLGRGEALRSAVEKEPDPRVFRNTTEPHTRGAYFAAAVFDAYREHFKSATEEIVRLATGGSGVLPAGRLASDLISMLTTQALESADRFLAMVVGAFNYLPACDVTFGDVVRAIVTADWALNPEDAAGVRRILIEGLRRRGIFPDDVDSLSEEALIWRTRHHDLRLAEDTDSGSGAATEEWTSFKIFVYEMVRDLSGDGARYKKQVERQTITPDTMRLPAGMGKFLRKWAYEHALELGLDPLSQYELEDNNKHPRRILIHRFNTSLRRSDERNIQPELIVQFTQHRDDLKTDGYAAFPGIDPRDLRWPAVRKDLSLVAGTTVVADIDGRIRHIVAKPLPLSKAAEQQHLYSESDPIAKGCHASGLNRLEEMLKWAVKVEDEDPLAVWDAEKAAVQRLDFASLHLNIQEAAAEQAADRRGVEKT